MMALQEKIQATLKAAREVWPNREIHAIFQPHRYTRVRNLEQDFCQSFDQVDHVWVCPIYRAGEKPIEGLDRYRLGQGIEKTGHPSVQVVDNLNEIPEKLAAQLRPDSVVITLGAGDVNSICNALAERIS